jgi:signal-transduction protein with cAMP-binding, CBS, and nucleotidyltransferase domain
VENTVEAIMSKKVETIDRSDSVQSAARKMRDKKISSLIVLDKSKERDELLGIVTESDIVRRVCAEGTSLR